MARLASVTCGAIWRRDGDSNPGEALTSTRFPGVRLKPLGHPSDEKPPLKTGSRAGGNLSGAYGVFNSIRRRQCQTSICRYAGAALFLLASHNGADHAGVMFRLLLRILAVTCAGMTSLMIWQDLSAPSNASKPLGRIWHDLHSGSLQVSEAVVSRFIDPCGLVIALDCTPFLWHPLIASVLGWPAGLIGCVLTGILWFFGRPKQRHGRPSKRALSR
jgi:hypothetical protein